jgi:hypothetical protein
MTPVAFSWLAICALLLAAPGAAQPGYQSYVDSVAGGAGSDEHLLRCEFFFCWACERARLGRTRTFPRIRLSFLT